MLNLELSVSVTVSVTVTVSATPTVRLTLSVTWVTHTHTDTPSQLPLLITENVRGCWLLNSDLHFNTDSDTYSDHHHDGAWWWWWWCEWLLTLTYTYSKWVTESVTVTVGLDGHYYYDYFNLNFS